MRAVTPDDFAGPGLDEMEVVWGAADGQEGPDGNRYVIPLGPGLAGAAERFTELATEWDQTTFYVLPLPKDSGYAPAEVAPLFAEAYKLYNVRLPREFAENFAQLDQL